MNDKDHIKIVVRNRKAYHDFNITHTVEAGISLHGTEVKSIRAGRVNISDAYARSAKGGLLLINMHVSPWDTANSYDQHDPTRPRRLLLHKREIRKLVHEIEAKGHTLVPLSLYFKHGRLKVELGLAKGKRSYDKRQSSLKKEADRDMERAQKRSGFDG